MNKGEILVNWLETYSVMHYNTVHSWSRKPNDLILHKPMMYGVMHLLYGVAISGNVLKDVETLLMAKCLR